MFLLLYHICDENHKENPYCSYHMKHSTSIAVEHKDPTPIHFSNFTSMRTSFTYVQFVYRHRDRQLSLITSYHIMYGLIIHSR